MTPTTPEQIKSACNDLAECMMVEHALQEQEVTVKAELRLAHSKTMAAKDALKDLSIW